MSEVRKLVGALKQCLRARGLTYAQLARRLNLSEASVKRIFARGSFTLARLEAICNVLEITFQDLARVASPDDPRITTLSMEQEAALARDPNLLTTFYLLLNDWTPAEIRREYAFDERQQRKLLAQLDDLGLIELLPRLQCRLRVGRRVVWRRDGPVRRAYEKQVKAEFLQAAFNRPSELLRFQPAELTEHSIRTLHRKLEQLYREFLELAELDLLATEPRTPVAMLLAFRPWVFSLVAQRKRSAIR
ncbi:MAG TPA: helix-turn-helix transcriptional regulator [Steroidobacteraceae bacterium]